MRRAILIVTLVMLGSSIQTFCQERERKGNYASYGSLILEDNSFLVEEAFNQDMGVIQYISTVAFDRLRYNQLQFSFTQEIPITDQTHQLSYTLLYTVQPQGSVNGSSNGFGDLSISYRPMVFDQDDWLMFIPRFTVIVPTGNASYGLGAGGLGLQFNAAITKRISKRIVTHYNIGVTEYFNYRHYRTENDKHVLDHKRDLFYKNIATSVIWYVTPRLNMMAEYVLNFEKEIDDSGKRVKVNQQVLNPAFRYCFSLNNMQVVPGISMPITIEQNKVVPSAMFYLSFEPAYR